MGCHGVLHFLRGCMDFSRLWGDDRNFPLVDCAWLPAIWRSQVYNIRYNTQCWTVVIFSMGGISLNFICDRLLPA